MLARVLWISHKPARTWAPYWPDSFCRIHTFDREERGPKPWLGNPSGETAEFTHDRETASAASDMLPDGNSQIQPPLERLQIVQRFQ